MTFWIVAAAVAVVGFALAWWTSGRAKPDTRRRSFGDAISIGRAEVRTKAKGGGDGGNTPTGGMSGMSPF